MSIEASDILHQTLCGIAMRTTACKVVTPYPLEVGNWGVDFNGFLYLRDKVGEGDPWEIEEQATDAASAASDGERNPHRD